MDIRICKHKNITATAPGGMVMFKYIIEKLFLDEDRQHHMQTFYVWAKTNTEAIKLAFEHPFLNCVNIKSELSLSININESDKKD